MNITPNADDLTRLAEAIRAGAQSTKSGTGRYFSLDKEGQICACTLGAAIIGARPQLLGKVLNGTECNAVLLAEFPFAEYSSPFSSELEFEQAFSPAATAALREYEYRWSMTWHTCIVGLTDILHWSREQIADWLLEKAQAL